MIKNEMPSLEKFCEKENRIKELYRKKQLIAEEIDTIEKKHPVMCAKYWHDIFLAKKRIKK